MPMPHTLQTGHGLYQPLGHSLGLAQAPTFVPHPLPWDRGFIPHIGLSVAPGSQQLCLSGSTAAELIPAEKVYTTTTTLPTPAFCAMPFATPAALPYRRHRLCPHDCYIAAPHGGPAASAFNPTPRYTTPPSYFHAHINMDEQLRRIIAAIAYYYPFLFRHSIPLLF